MSPAITLRHRFEYVLFRMAEWGVARLSFNGALTVGRGLGRLSHLLDGRHRRVVRENLRDVDLGLTEAEVRTVARDCFAHFGSLLTSTLRLNRMSKEELLCRVTFEGLEHWDAALAEGKGVIGLTGHYGNWEAMALGLSALNRPLAVIGREPDNPLLAPYLRAVRGRFGNTVIPKSGAVRDALKVLKKGQVVGFLLDQDALTHGVFVKFLGRWASTFPSAALLACKYDLPIVPIFSRPGPHGTVHVQVQPRLPAIRTGESEKDIWMTTQLMTRCLEAQIRMEPRWWFWMHRRFKTKPLEGHPSPAVLPPSEWQDAIPLANPGR